MANATDFVTGLISLTRPLEWSKTLGNMVIAYFLAAYFLQQPFNANLINPLQFLIAFIAVGPLLWGGLYTLNDWTDRNNDRLHPVKRLRAIPSGRVSANTALIFSILLILSAFFIAFFVLNSMIFLICLIAMLINQILYTIEPFHFKSRKVLDLISGSIVNPFFRFFAGWVLLIPYFNAPLLMLLFVIGFQFAGYLLYRLSTKALETKIAFKSSGVMFDENFLKKLAHGVGVLSAVSFIAMTLIPIFAPSLSFFGVLPFNFIILILLSLFLTPLYFNAVVDPQRMDMKKMHTILYIHYTLFVIGYVLLFLFF
ncbi:MAG: UbiA family prenyltransferase [archaeon]|nr:UbiA family prenyltransferase [archaeon]